MQITDAKTSFDELAAFLAVSRTLSFVHAATALGVSASALSRRIAILEKRLDSRLFQRSTRKVSLTEAGSIYLRYVQNALGQLVDGEAALSDLRTEPKGTLRLALPNLFGQVWVAPRLSQLLQRYPSLNIEVSLNDRYVDLIAEGFDLAIRIGKLENSRLVARRLASSRRVLCATPEYIENFGVPTHPEDLGAHACLHFLSIDEKPRWHLTRKGTARSVTITPRAVSDNTEALRQLALAGCGIALVSSFTVSSDLSAGRLRRVLPGWSSPDNPIWLVYPDARFMPTKTRVVKDFLIEKMAEDDSFSLFT